MNYQIIQNIEVPTGNILIVQGDKGELECLSIGDYGKEKNLKADFMGLNKEINGVPHGDLLPLEKKWVITISSQYGCSMDCTFCDVPLVGKGRNASVDDLLKQVESGLSLHPEVKSTKRLNLHYARMGEPTFNFNVIESAKRLKEYFINKSFGFHPVVSTMMPKSNRNLGYFLDQWMEFKNFDMSGEAGLQISINSTDDVYRDIMFSGNALSLKMVSEVLASWDIVGRKIALNFAITNKSIIDPKKLFTLFNPDKFLCKLTPVHETKTALKNDIKTEQGYDHYYPYQKVEKELKEVGFDVIVFVPSKEEDESRITCGNAILSNFVRIM